MKKMDRLEVKIYTKTFDQQNTNLGHFRINDKPQAISNSYHNLKSHSYLDKLIIHFHSA